MHSAILRTLVYADIFDYPLTASEIHQRLIGHSGSLNSIKKSLKNNNKVDYKNSFYFLKGRQEIVAKRRKRQIISRGKLNYAKRVGKWLKIFPTIQAVLITGTISVANATARDDIDILIITKANSLWTTRLLVNTILDILSLRRRPNTQQLDNKLCLNIWIDISTLSVKKSQRNLYSAHEVIQTKPLWDRNNTHSKFLAANSWVKDYLPNASKELSLTEGLAESQRVTAKLEGASLLENLTYQLQLKYMKSKKTREKITQHSAFFHPRNLAPTIMQKYRQRLKKLGIHD